MADSPDTAEGCYKWLTGSKSPGYGWKWDKSYGTNPAQNQPAAEDKPAPKDPKNPTLEYFVAKT